MRSAPGARSRRWAAGREARRAQSRVSCSSMPMTTAERDAGESGASNVTVLLNGRFSTRTDASGRFEFPFVAAGVHTITVPPDNLPLPWVFGDSKREVDVGTRSSAMVEIGARRLR